jgi:hypothetical protein
MKNLYLCLECSNTGELDTGKSCQECCEHGDYDHGICGMCDKDCLDDLIGKAEYLYERD